MSHIVHHCIVVTSWNGSDIRAAHDAAAACGLFTSPIIESPINAHFSFLVSPDGSGEGWDESDAGDENREKFKAWLRGVRHEDGSSSLSWFEAAYSPDDRRAEIIEDEWEDA